VHLISGFNEVEYLKTTIIPIADVEDYELGDQETKTSRRIRDVFQSKNMRVHHAVFNARARMRITRNIAVRNTHIRILKRLFT